VCKRTFSLKEIKVKGFLENTYIFQTICSNHTNPVATVYITQFEKRKLTTLNKIESSISKEDILAMSNALKDFDGDFDSALE